MVFQTVIHVQAYTSIGHVIRATYSSKEGSFHRMICYEIGGHSVSLCKQTISNPEL